MFSVAASTRPAPATYDTNGADAGSAAGTAGGCSRLPVTEYTANNTPTTARAGNMYLRIIVCSNSLFSIAEAQEVAEKRESIGDFLCVPCASALDRSLS